MCHVSRATCHMSPVTCHLSHIYIFIFSKNWTKWWCWLVEGLLSTVPIPSSFCNAPRIQIWRKNKQIWKKIFLKYELRGVHGVCFFKSVVTDIPGVNPLSLSCTFPPTLIPFSNPHKPALNNCRNQLPADEHPYSCAH